MKRYKYTLLKQDGTEEDLGVEPKLTFAAMYKILACELIQIIPREYYGKKGRYSLYGDEEGRFKETNRVNPHFQTLAPGYNVVGDIIKEEVYKEL